MNDRKDDLRNVGTFVALFGVVVLALGLLLLIGTVFPAALFIVIVLVFAPMLFAFHYLLWGWWMSALPPLDEEDES